MLFRQNGFFFQHQLVSTRWALAMVVVFTPC